MKRWLILFFVASVIIIGSLFALTATWQREDLKTIRTAKEVDAFIKRYCEDTRKLPTAAALQGKFPYVTRESGWLFYTGDDSTWLSVQYPVRWRNKEAIGERRISEFTATVYAYTVDYSCTGAR